MEVTDGRIEWPGSPARQRYVESVPGRDRFLFEDGAGTFQHHFVRNLPPVAACATVARRIMAHHRCPEAIRPALRAVMDIPVKYWVSCEGPTAYGLARAISALKLALPQAGCARQPLAWMLERLIALADKL
jgi:hypothetical protein